MKIIFGLLFAITLVFSTSISAQNKSIYEYTVEDIYSQQVEMSSFKGKKIMIVNVASKCGLTPQYEQLQELYDTYQDDDFVIIGFPANNFNGQEPGSNAEIISFCESKFDVTFPMMGKISVVGDDMAPIYQWLTQKSLNGVSDSKVTWNFQKYLIDEKGNLIEMIPPKESPISDKVLEWISSQ